jgi:hypothetical protein
MQLVMALVMYILTGLLAHDSIESFMEGSTGWGVTFAVWALWCITIGILNMVNIYRD